MKIVLSSDGSVELTRGERITRGQDLSRRIYVEWNENESPIDTGQILAENMVVQLCITRPDGEQSGWYSMIKIDAEDKYYYTLQAWDTAVSGEASLQVRWYDIALLETDFKTDVCEQCGNQVPESGRTIYTSEEAFFIVDNGKIAQPLNISSENYNEIVLQFITPLAAQAFRKYDVNSLPSTIKYNLDGEKTAPALYFNFTHEVSSFETAGENSQEVVKTCSGMLLVNNDNNSQTELFITSDGKIYIRSFKNIGAAFKEVFPNIDTTLTKGGMFADAKTVGDELAKLASSNIENGKGEYSIQGKNSVTKEKDRRNFANGEASFAGGHGSKTYQRDTFSYGGSCQAGMTEEEFNAYFWDETNQVPLHGGYGKNEQGQILDNSNSTYAKSYGFALAGGEGNKALARATLALIAYNTVTGEKSGAIGEHNEIPGKNSHSVGDYSRLFANFLQALGRYLWSETDKQILLGHHNLRDENALLIVGNGAENSGWIETSVNAQGRIDFHHRNAMTIKKNGAFHTDSRVNDTNMPVIEYYVENGQVKTRVVEGEYDKTIFHIRNESFGDTDVDLVIDKDGNLVFKTLNHNKENGLGAGYVFKQLTVDKHGRVVVGHTVNANDENPVVLDIKMHSSSQFKVKANGQVIGRHLTQDDDEDGTLTTKDYVLRKISENGGGGTSPDITAELAKKLDKRTDVTTTHSVYAKSADGTQQWLVGYSSGDTPLTIVQRTHTGAVVVGPPTEDKHATPRKYVDENKGTKLFYHHIELSDGFTIDIISTDKTPYPYFYNDYLNEYRIEWNRYGFITGLDWDSRRIIEIMNETDIISIQDGTIYVENINQYFDVDNFVDTVTPL